MAQVARLAFRVEGKWWRCYLAPLHGMEGATEMGAIRMTLVEGNADTKAAFMGAMKSAFAAMCEELFGAETSFPPPRPAPESERSGHA